MQIYGYRTPEKMREFFSALKVNFCHSFQYPLAGDKKQENKLEKLADIKSPPRHLSPLVVESAGNWRSRRDTGRDSRTQDWAVELQGSAEYAR